MKVYKFGGASIKDAESIKNVVSILKKETEPIVVVVSALGKMTNNIEKVLDCIFDNDQKEALFLWEEICAKHIELITELGAFDLCEFYLNTYITQGISLIQNCSKDNYDFVYDQFVPFGELMSTTILVAYMNSISLSSKWIDARRMIYTDDSWRAANVLWEQTISEVNRRVTEGLKNFEYVITQGFIAGTISTFSSTLGREGSDYTAAILSHCLDAESMSIWKDVPGVLTADPRLFSDVELIPLMSYEEAIEMTYYGAQVIHPKTIQPIQKKNIPLYVKSFITPGTSGTIIDSDGTDVYPPMIVVSENQYLLQFSTKDYSFIAEKHLSTIFQKFNHYRVRVNLMRNTAISFIVSVSVEENRLKHLKLDLQENFIIKEQSSVELITVRHYTKPVIKKLKEGREVLFEEKQGVTFQMVVIA